jgi:hypothetical protein
MATETTEVTLREHQQTLIKALLRGARGNLKAAAAKKSWDCRASLAMTNTFRLIGP